eukprot:jgi/Bigna1/75667/fgenesh1_pg.36_\
MDDDDLDLDLDLGNLEEDLKDLAAEAEGDAILDAMLEEHNITTEKTAAEKNVGGGNNFAGLDHLDDGLGSFTLSNDIDLEDDDEDDLQNGGDDSGDKKCNKPTIRPKKQADMKTRSSVPSLLSVTPPKLDFLAKEQAISDQYVGGISAALTVKSQAETGVVFIVLTNSKENIIVKPKCGLLMDSNAIGVVRVYVKYGLNVDAQGKTLPPPKNTKLLFISYPMSDEEAQIFADEDKYTLWKNLRKRDIDSGSLTVIPLSWKEVESGKGANVKISPGYLPYYQNPENLDMWAAKTTISVAKAAEEGYVWQVKTDAPDRQQLLPETSGYLPPGSSKSIYTVVEGGHDMYFWSIISTRSCESYANIFECFCCDLLTPRRKIELPEKPEHIFDATTYPQSEL